MSRSVIAKRFSKGAAKSRLASPAREVTKIKEQRMMTLLETVSVGGWTEEYIADQHRGEGKGGKPLEYAEIFKATRSSVEVLACHD